MQTIRLIYQTSSIPKLGKWAYLIWEPGTNGPDYRVGTYAGRVDTYLTGTYKPFAFIESKDSVLTPNYYDKKKLVVKYKSKINLDTYLRRPIPPRFNPPKYKPISKPKFWFEPVVFSIPVNSANLSLRQYNLWIRKLARRAHRQQEVRRARTLKKFLARMQWYETTIAKRTMRTENYLAAFRKRLDKYEKRMAIYEKRVAKVAKWRPHYHRGGRARGNTPDNPYSRTRIWNIDAQIYSFNRSSSWLYSGSYLSDGTNSAIFGVPADYRTYPAPVVKWDITPLDSPTFEQVFVLGSPVRDALSLIHSEMEAKLKRKLSSKLGNRKVHVANILAERAQTMGMFRDAVKRAASFLQAKKHVFATVGNYVKHPEKVSNDFLAVQFGVKPLLSDIVNSAEMLAATVHVPESDDVVIRSNEHRDFEVSFNHLGVVYTAAGTTNMSIVYRYSIDDGWLFSLSSLGLINPIEVAWEMMPWSFVVDWFLPVGRFLESLTSDMGVSFTRGTKTVTTHCKVTSSYQPQLQGDNSLLSNFSGVAFSGSFVIELKDRVVLGDAPTYTSLEDSAWFHQIKNPLTLSHNLDALALVVQRIR